MKPPYLILKSIAYLISRATLILILFIALIFACIHLQADNYITSDTKDLTKKYTAIVLGAGLINEEKLSPIFKDRIDVAITLYKEGYVTAILISGDDGTAVHNEVNPAREYMLAQAIPSEAIFLDHAGFDTYSSMYRAKEVFLVHSAIVVTQSFHLPRAVFIARNLGLDAIGMSSDLHRYRLKNTARELLANVKAFGDILYGRQPKYLGKEIPITGDSSISI